MVDLMRDRKRILRSMCVKANNSIGSFPLSKTVEALDVLVSRLFDKKLTKPIAILEGECDIELNPYIRGKRFVYCFL